MFRFVSDSWIRSDEGLKLETSAFESLYGGQFTLSTQLIKPDYEVKSDHRSKFSNLSNWKEEVWKNQGFNGIRTRDLRDTGAMLYQLSYEATHWERGQFIEFISPVRSEMTWSRYEIIHIWTAVVDESEEWSSQLIFQFKQLEWRSLKKSGLQRDSNPWPPRYRCDALPTEL